MKPIKVYILTAAIITLFLVTVDCAPFFDAIYSALNGNNYRSYGGYGYNYDNGYEHHRPQSNQRSGKTWKEICRVHFPDSIANPGAGGVVCPY